MASISSNKQRGITLVGLIFVLAILGAVGVLGLKVAPTVMEYFSIKKAVATAKNAGSAPEIRAAFDRQTEVGYISSIAGKDLDIVNVNGNVEVNFAYAKKISLVGPTSLLIEYAGTTANSAGRKAAQ